MTGEKNRMRMRHAALVALMAAGLLTGCKKQPEPQPETNFIEEAPEEAPPPALPVEEPAPPPSKEREPVTNVAEALPPETPVSPDEQMLEDADATGLTARRAAAANADDPVGDLIENEGIR